MAFVIALPCVGVKDTACVVVCPMDCIHPLPGSTAFATAEQLYIEPDVCIDCGLCAGECPANAIFHAEDVPSEWANYVEKNAAYFRRRE